MNTSRLIVCLLLSLWLPPALAIELYRGDKRTPEDVFLTGFTAAGTNADPLAHVAGTSCINTNAPASQRSAFVAMSIFPHHAMYYGNYVYRITPNADAGDETATFNVAAGLGHIDEHPDHYRLPLRQYSTVQRLRTFNVVLGQHISRRIPPEWIHSAELYQYDPATGTNRFVERHHNPYFREPANTASRARFSAEMIAAMGGEPPEIVVTAAAPNGTSVSVCMASTDSCGTSAPQSVLFTVERPPLVCQSEQTLLPDDPFHQVLDIILD